MPAADDRLRTGSPDLDFILGGGLPRGSTTVIAGPPGSGKTVLAQQIAFANATAENPVLYYTSWSEPHAKLLRNLSGFDFFDEKAIGQRIEVLHLPSISQDPRVPDLEEMSQELFRASVERQPAMVVIDSSKALHGLVPEDQLRRVFYELASRVGQTRTVLLLVGEYTPAEIEQEPEFAVADGILQFANESRGLTDRRWVRVVKMRGSANLPGQHSLTISERGIQAFPRLETIVPGEPVPQHDRAGLGDEGFDRMTGGGLPRGDGTLVLGPAGIGKTVLGLAFIAEGLRLGESALYLSFQETSAELVAKATALGWPQIASGFEQGRLQIIQMRPVDLDLDQVGITLRDGLQRGQAKRVVVDSVAELNLRSREPDRYLSYLWAIVHLVTAYGATGIFTQETTTLGPQVSQELLSFVFQNVITMRFVEYGEQLSRAIGTFKMRASSHDTDLLEFKIGPKRLTTLGKIAGLSGLLGWSALRKEG